jgi:acetylornithine deacetylase/succinyl-diaminopimelate desuccinylase-like protein
VVGEERGSDGARAAATLEPKGRFLVNGEPTEGLLCVAQKGSLQVRVEAHGTPAHSAYPEEGSSAILKLLTTLDRLRRMPLPFDPVLGPATLNIGVISGGSAPNVIPEHASAELSVRTIGPSDDLQARMLALADPDVTISCPRSWASGWRDGRPRWSATRATCHCTIAGAGVSSWDRATSGWRTRWTSGFPARNCGPAWTPMCDSAVS